MKHLLSIKGINLDYSPDGAQRALNGSIGHEEMDQEGTGFWSRLINIRTSTWTNVDLRLLGDYRTVGIGAE